MKEARLRKTNALIHGTQICDSVCVKTRKGLMRRRDLREVENIESDGMCALGKQKEEAQQREEREPKRMGNRGKEQDVYRCRAETLLSKNFNEREKTLSVKSDLGWTGLYFNMA